MAVRIPSDLVVDVMRAADPARVQAAARKLSAAPGTAVAAAAFGEALQAAAVAPSQQEAPGSDLVIDVMRAGEPNARRAATHKLASLAGVPADAYGQFESFMLRDAFEAMLPKDNETAYGAGFAGGVWRTMAAEQYASIFTERGGLGIAEMLRRRAPAAAQIPAGDGQWPYFPAAQAAS